MKRSRLIVAVDLWNQGVYEGAMVLAYRPVFGHPDPTVVRGSRVKIEPIRPGEDIAEGTWLGRRIIVAVEYLRQ